MPTVRQLKNVYAVLEKIDPDLQFKNIKINTLLEQALKENLLMDLYAAITGNNNDDVDLKDVVKEIIFFLNNTIQIIVNSANTIFTQQEKRKSMNG